MAHPSANENAFLGAIVGIAIGDALGLPVNGMSEDAARAKHGDFEDYLELDGMPEGQPTRGVISDKTEVVLSMIESLTTNDAELDPENIIHRMRFLVDSPSRVWISDTVAEGIEKAFENDGQVLSDAPAEPEPAVLVRGLPLGLLHAIGELDREALQRDARTAARLSHADEASAALVAQVAEATALAARYVDREPTWRDELRLASNHPLSIGIAAIVDRVIAADTFEEAVLPVVRQGGDAAALGAIAGGIAGARFGAAGLPQQFIDDLDARIYLSMAAPWFYRTVLRRNGLAVDLPVTEQYPR
jgi:ADP-ribosyl-[dinitrogen reductase] hydrolase